jgi:hypothetical protein
MMDMMGAMREPAHAAPMKSTPILEARFLVFHCDCFAGAGCATGGFVAGGAPAVMMADGDGAAEADMAATSLTAGDNKVYCNAEVKERKAKPMVWTEKEKEIKNGKNAMIPRGREKKQRSTMHNGLGPDPCSVG